MVKVYTLKIHCHNVDLFTSKDGLLFLTTLKCTLQHNWNVVVFQYLISHSPTHELDTCTGIKLQ